MPYSRVYPRFCLAGGGGGLGHENLGHDSRCPCRDSDRTSPGALLQSLGVATPCGRFPRCRSASTNDPLNLQPCCHIA
jgi:hypothetical protein